MEENYFKVRYSQLDTDALRGELILRYELEEPVACRFFDYGMNDIYIVTAGTKVYYLRISLANMHRLRDYQEETLILNALDESDIRVAIPIGLKNGKFVWEINAPEGKRFAVLFSEVKKVPSEDRVKQAYNLGNMLARMHRASDQHAFVVSRTPITFKQLVENPLDKVEPYLIKRPKDYDFLYSAADKLWKYIEKELNYEKPFYGYCHGDIHSGNVFFEGDIPRIFDFDCMGYGWRAYDICVFAWNETFSDEKFMESEVWASYLDGYNAIRQLEENEMRAMNAFGALRQLWMIGIHADVMKRNAGCCWHDDDYFDYQIGIFKLWYNRAFL